jgi:hypothetical protein
MRRFTSGEYLLAVTVIVFAVIWSVLRFIVTPLIVR